MKIFDGPGGFLNRGGLSVPGIIVEVEEK